MSLRRALLILLALSGYAAYGFVSAGCAELGGQDPRECSSGADCEAGEVCIGAICREPECADDADTQVPQGSNCDASDNDIEEDVPDDVFCESGEVVDEQTDECVAACASDGDCDAGEHCTATGQCATSPCTDTPVDSCPKETVCDPGTGRCVQQASGGGCPGTSVDLDGVCRKPCGFGDCIGTDEICDTTANECRDRCSADGNCGAGQECVSGVCQSATCVLPGDCTDSSCDAGVCKPDCVVAGCAGGEFCNQRDGLCEPTPILNITPSITTSVDPPGNITLDVAIGVVAGQQQASLLQIEIDPGITIDPFTPSATVSSVTFDDGSGAVPIGSWIATSADRATFTSDGSPYDEGEDPVLARVSASELVAWIPHGGDGSPFVDAIEIAGTLSFGVPVTAPATTEAFVGAIVKYADPTTGGWDDSTFPGGSTIFVGHTVTVSPDTDDDGVPDTLEAAHGTDPDNPDTDYDGLSDGDEIDLGLDPLYADTDGDGFSDGEEIGVSDPLDASSVPVDEETLWYEANLYESSVDATEPVIEATGIDACAGGGSVTAHRALWADGSDVFTADVDCDGAGAPTLAYDAADFPPACGGFTAAVEVDSAGDSCMVRGTCTSDFVDRVLVGPCDGSGPLAIVAAVGDAVGSETLTAFDVSRLGDEDTLVVNVQTTGARTVASCPLAGGGCSVLTDAAALGASVLNPGLECDRVGTCWVTTTSPESLARVPLTGLESIVLAAGDPNPAVSSQSVLALLRYAADANRVGVALSTAEDVFAMLVDATGGVIHTVARSDDPIPGSVGAVSLTDPMAVSGDRALVAGTDDAGERGVYGHRTRADGSIGPVTKIMRRGDLLSAVNSTVHGAVTGGEVFEATMSSRALSEDVIALNVSLESGSEYAVVLLVPGPVDPRVRGRSTQPAPGGTTRIFEFTSAPSLLDLIAQPFAQGISGLTVDRTTGLVYASSGFGGGGVLYDYGTGDGPLASIGATGFAAVPGLAFAPDGTLYASVATGGGFGNGLATLNTGTGAGTLIATWFTGAATPVSGIDAIAWDPIRDSLWAITGNAFDGTPGDVFEANLVTGELTRIGDIPDAPGSIAGADFSLLGDLFLTIGGGDGRFLRVDRSAIGPGALPPTPPDLPLWTLGDISVSNASHSDIAVLDSDGDDLTDAEETSIGTEPTLADTDGDGLGDGAEWLRIGTNPLNFDSDGDNLPDGDEILVHGTDPLLFDTDGDGASDGAEIAAGTDPNDPQDFPPPPPVPALPLAHLALLVGAIAASARSLLRRRIA